MPDDSLEVGASEDVQGSGTALLVKFAFVLDHLRQEAKLRYMRAGWPPCDAETEAKWLLLVPEDDREDAVLAEAYTPWPVPSE
jgi:hypothetical protein